MSRSKKKLDEGFWLTPTGADGTELARMMEFAIDGYNTVHSTAKIESTGGWIEYCTIGPRSFVGQYVEMTDVKVGADCHIAEGTRIVDYPLEIPDGSWVESTNSYGLGNEIVLLWTPGGLLVKPGCLPLEPVEKTLKRLAKPDRIHQWLSYYAYRCPMDLKALAEPLIRFLEEMQGYRVE